MYPRVASKTSTCASETSSFREQMKTFFQVSSFLNDHAYPSSLLIYVNTHTIFRYFLSAEIKSIKKDPLPSQPSPLYHWPAVLVGHLGGSRAATVCLNFLKLFTAFRGLPFSISSTDFCSISLCFPCFILTASL